MLSSDALIRLVASEARIAIQGENLAKISKVIIGNVEVSGLIVDDPTLQFLVPEGLADGEYPLSMQSKDGKEINYNGSSTCTIVITAETTLWEGTHNVTWGTPFDGLKTTMKNQCRSGSVVRLYVTGNGQGTAATGWWNNVLTGKGDPERGDIIIQGDMVLEFVLTDYSMEIMEAQEGFLVVGNGFTLKKITVQ